MASKVALITGCSSGVGLSLSVLLAQNSYRVYATMRNLDKKGKLESEAGSLLNNNLFIRQLDVTDDVSSQNCVKEIIEKEGRIDILVNNAGQGVSGLIEDQSVAVAKENFETNFFGVYRLTREVVPHLKKQKSGHIINLSSVGGINGVPFNDIYCASKFALEGFSESLAPTLKVFNVHVSLIEPGPIITDFVANAVTRMEDVSKSTADDKTKEIFATYRQRMLAGFNPEMGQTGLQVAECIKKVLEMENPPFRYCTPTHPAFATIAQLKYVDPTGNQGIELAYKRFFG